MTQKKSEQFCQQTKKRMKFNYDGEKMPQQTGSSIIGFLYRNRLALIGWESFAALMPIVFELCCEWNVQDNVCREQDQVDACWSGRGSPATEQRTDSRTLKYRSTYVMYFDMLNTGLFVALLSIVSAATTCAQHTLDLSFLLFSSSCHPPVLCRSMSFAHSVLSGRLDVKILSIIFVT